MARRAELKPRNVVYEEICRGRAAVWGKRRCGEKVDSRYEEKEKVDSSDPCCYNGQAPFLTPDTRLGMSRGCSSDSSTPSSTYLR